MKTTYTRTLFRSDLTKATFILELFEGLKFRAEDYTEKIEYTGVTSWDLISGGEEAEEIEAEGIGEMVDEYHEYLVLHFQDGKSATFRNSHVALFVI